MLHNNGRYKHMCKSKAKYNPQIQYGPISASQCSILKKKINVLFNDTQHILVTVIWRQTYGKGPLRLRERKPAAATGATLSD